MAKTSIKPRLGITTWDEADEKLQLLGEIQRQKDTRKAGFEARIEKLKSRMKQEMDGYTQRMNALAQEIYLFALSRDDLDGRSKKLLHGTVAFRQVSELKIPRDQSDIIALLKRLGREDLIRTKEEVDKVNLKREDEQLINQVGGKLIKRDAFRIELPEYSYDYDKKLKAVRR
jgi:phage host-nuclease inhibitor protein Gam